MSEDFEASLPLPQKPHRRPMLKESREAERLSVGGFFAEHRAVVDARKDHLARLGMDERQASALRMPTREDEPLAALGTPAVQAPTFRREEDHVP